MNTIDAIKENLNKMADTDDVFIQTNNPMNEIDAFLAKHNVDVLSKDEASKGVDDFLNKYGDKRVSREMR